MNTLTAERLIAVALMGLSIYFMVHATVLPIGWEGSSGPGGGAFPFWLSAIMLVASAGILLRSFKGVANADLPFFDSETIGAVAGVAGALVLTILAIPYAGSYIAIFLFQIWYLRFFGKHSWGLTLILTVGTSLFLFFFFEVTLKILLPKGITEPLFLPLYAIFF